MFGANAFGVLAFGFVDVAASAVAPPGPSTAPVIAHLAGAAEAFAVVGRDVVVAVSGREPRALTFTTKQVQ